MFRIIETTTDSRTVAEMISESIINSKLSPCVHIIDAVTSNYIRKTLNLRFDQLKNIKMIYEDLNVISRKDKYDGVEIEVEGKSDILKKIENLINK